MAFTSTRLFLYYQVQALKGLMTNMGWMQIVTFACIIGMPIVPAYLLFRVLPSTGNVEGKLFKGLEIKLGGAFAGYFAVILVIFQNYAKLFPPPPPAPPPTAFVWHLSGQVVDSTGTPIEPLDIKDFAFSPPTFQAIPGGHFNLVIPTEPQQGGGTKYPMLVISHQSFRPLQIPLEPSELSPEMAASLGAKWDKEHKWIKMDRIPLSAPPPYHPTGPPPKRVSGKASKRHLASLTEPHP